MRFNLEDFSLLVQKVWESDYLQGSRCILIFYANVLDIQYDNAITARCGTLLSCSESKLRIFPSHASRRSSRSKDYISSQDSVIISSKFLRASMLGRLSCFSREVRSRLLSHEPRTTF